MRRRITNKYRRELDQVRWSFVAVMGVWMLLALLASWSSTHEPATSNNTTGEEHGNRNPRT